MIIKQNAQYPLTGVGLSISADAKFPCGDFVAHHHSDQ